MIIRNTLLAVAGLFMVGMVAPQPAQAAPPVAAGMAQSIDKGQVEKVHALRRCWWRNGKRHCRYVRHRHRWGHRYGYGPGFRFYFGPSHRGWHHGRHGNRNRRHR